MNMNKKKVIATALVATVVGSGLFAAKQTFAAETTVTTTNPMSSLVQEIATKFGLKTADVQAVFDQNRSEMQAQRETNFEAKLTQDVTDGKITDAQKQLIISKRKELDASRQSKMESIKTMTEEQRKAARAAEKTALETWAKENNLDARYLMFGGMGGRGHGPGGRGHGPGGPATSAAK